MKIKSKIDMMHTINDGEEMKKEGERGREGEDINAS